MAASKVWTASNASPAPDAVRSALHDQRIGETGALRQPGLARRRDAFERLQGAPRDLIVLETAVRLAEQPFEYSHHIGLGRGPGRGRAPQCLGGLWWPRELRGISGAAETSLSGGLSGTRNDSSLVWLLPPRSAHRLGRRVVRPVFLLLSESDNLMR